MCVERLLVLLCKASLQRCVDTSVLSVNHGHQVGIFLLRDKDIRLHLAAKLNLTMLDSALEAAVNSCTNVRWSRSGFKNH